MSHLDELLSDVVVGLEPLRLDVLLVDLDAEPVEVLGDHVVRIGVDLLGVGVLEPEHQLTVVPLAVLVVEDGYPGVSDVEGSGGTGCDTHDGFLILSSLEGGELVGPDLLLLLHHGGVGGGEFGLLLLETEGVDIGDDGVDGLGDLGDLGPVFRVGPQDLPYDGFGVGGTFEEHRVLQCEFSDGFLDGLGHNAGTIPARL